MEKKNALSTEQEDMQRVYKPEQIAAILQVSLRHAYNLCDGKRFRVKRCGKSSIRADKESFDAWYRSNEN